MHSGALMVVLECESCTRVRAECGGSGKSGLACERKKIRCSFSNYGRAAAGARARGQLKAKGKGAAVAKGSEEPRAGQSRPRRRALTLKGIQKRQPMQTAILKRRLDLQITEMEEICNKIRQECQQAIFTATDRLIQMKVMQGIESALTRVRESDSESEDDNDDELEDSDE